MKEYDAPQYLKDYLYYIGVIKGRSELTIHNYYTDLKLFFRFLKVKNNMTTAGEEFDKINIADVPIEIIQKVNLSVTYEFLQYITRERNNDTKARARKVSSIKQFFKYLNTKTSLLPENPLVNLEIPAIKKSMPKYLTLEQAIELLRNIKTANTERDFCLMVFFLNCGIRLSELVGIDISDVKIDDDGHNTLRVLGKGNKERIIYLNSACVDAYNNYMKVRPDVKNCNALFLSKQFKRISSRRVEQIVDDCLKSAGLSDMGFSVHKLRHTAATLMYQNGVDIRVLQEILGHENLDTTQIYTHVISEQIEKAVQKNPLSKVKLRRPGEKQDK